MFRPRRPFRPGARQAFRRRPPLGPLRGVPPAVAEAEGLLRASQFGPASSRFEALAREAEDRGRPGAAGELYLRAARCYVEIDAVDQADGCAERAIHLFIRSRQPGRVRQVLPRVLAALERRGRHADAERLRREVADAFQDLGPLPGAPLEAPRGRLPAKCANCGAPVKPDEVAWSDPQTAECPYCGGIIKTE
jgi:hypothetical protein